MKCPEGFKIGTLAGKQIVLESDIRVVVVKSVSTVLGPAVRMSEGTGKTFGPARFTVVECSAWGGSVQTALESEEDCDA